MKTHRKSLRTFVLSTIAALLCTASFAAGANASPAWRFNGTALVGSETILSHAVEAGLAIPGLTTTCQPFVYATTISNSAGTGQGSVTEMPLSDCFTSSGACTVKAIGAESLPWTVKLTTIGGSNYLIITGFKVSILYGGAMCALNGTLATITGSAGGLIDNETESVTFSSASFTATKTGLKALGQPVEWLGNFTMLAIGTHIGESLTVS